MLLRFYEIQGRSTEAPVEFLGQRPLDLLLDQPRHGPGAHLRVVAGGGQPHARGIVHIQCDALLLQLHFGLDQQLADHALDGQRIERAELNDGIQSIAEFGFEEIFHSPVIFVCAVYVAKSNTLAFVVSSSQVTGQYNNTVASIGFLAVAGLFAISA